MSYFPIGARQDVLKVTGHSAALHTRLGHSAPWGLDDKSGGTFL